MDKLIVYFLIVKIYISRYCRKIYVIQSKLNNIFCTEHNKIRLSYVLFDDIFIFITRATHTDLDHLLLCCNLCYETDVCYQVDLCVVFVSWFFIGD